MKIFPMHGPVVKPGTDTLRSFCADQIIPVVVSQLLGVLSLPPSSLKDHVQQAAASSLLDLVASGQAELDFGMHCNVLVQGMQQGSLQKRACLAAVLGLLSICEQSKPAASKLRPQKPAFVQAVPCTVKLLIDAESAPWDCQAMVLSGLECLLHHLAGLKLFVQVGGIEVLSKILSKAGDVAAWGPDCDLDDDASDEDGSDELQQVWLLVLNLLYKAVKCISAGTAHVTATPLLTAILRCTSSHCEELQLAALDILSILASRPITWPAFAKAGHAWHLTVAAHSPCPMVQAKAVHCIHALAATFTQQEEETMVALGQSLSNSAHS